MAAIAEARVADITERAAHYPEVTAKIAGSEGVTTERARRLLEEALRFLEVAANSTDPVAPSQSVDVAWHHFILFTRDYAAYCDRYLGRFIHHQPEMQGDGDAAAYETTRAAIEATFGSLDEEL
jgi:hypothetical protein